MTLSARALYLGPFRRRAYARLAGDDNLTF